MLSEGHAAATVLSSGKPRNSDQLRLAFDGDAVLFSDDSEKIFKQHGLESFCENESQHAKVPLEPGPFQAFLAHLHDIQKLFPAGACPIRTALVTARSAPAHERVIRTLRGWNIRIDEAFFLGGMDKGSVLKAYGADIFFDDQIHHCQSAQQHVTTCHVPYGVANDQDITALSNQSDVR